MVEVFRFECWSPRARDMVLAPRAATRAAIAHIPSAVILEDTTLDVDESEPRRQRVRHTRADDARPRLGLRHARQQHRSEPERLLEAGVGARDRVAADPVVTGKY